jgi:hypothetical protein
MIPLKSETIGNVLKIMLWLLVGLSVVELAFSLVYAIDTDVFIDYVYSFYGIVEISSAVLYYIIIIIFLIWIYRVHMDLNRVFVQYERTPRHALACMMVPFYNFYGIPSTFRIIGRYYKTSSAAIQKEGRWTFGLAAPMLILFLITNGLNRVINKADEIGAGLMVSSSLFSLLLYVIYLMVCIMVISGLNKINAISAADASAQANIEANPVLAVPAVAQPYDDTQSL